MREQDGTTMRPPSDPSYRRDGAIRKALETGEPWLADRRFEMRSRLMLGPVAAVLMTIALSGVAAADSVTGQHGNYIFVDGHSQSTTGASCKYTDVGNFTYDIYKMVARAPQVWWPNTDSGNTTQHGRVGWKFSIYHKTPAALTWTLLKSSSVQKKTAYEDQLAPYSLATKAPFTNLSLSITAGNFPATELFMARVKVLWYRPDGTVKGSVTHDVQEYKWMSGTTLQGFNSNCVRRFLG